MMGNNSKENADRVVTIKEAAERLSVSKGTIHNWANAGLMPAKRTFGVRKVGWLESEFRAFLMKQSTPATA